MIPLASSRSKAWLSRSGVGGRLPGLLLGKPLQPQPVDELPRLRGRHRPLVTAHQVVPGGLLERVAVVVPAAQQRAYALLDLLTHLVRQRGHLFRWIDLDRSPGDPGVPAGLLPRPAHHGVCGETRGVEHGAEEALATLPVLELVVPAALVPHLGEDIRDIGYPLHHEEAIPVVADPVHQLPKAVHGRPGVRLVVLRLHLDGENLVDLHAPNDDTSH